MTKRNFKCGQYLFQNDAWMKLNKDVFIITNKLTRESEEREKKKKNNLLNK